jgi:hypothetical protein
VYVPREFFVFGGGRKHETFKRIEPMPARIVIDEEAVTALAGLLAVSNWFDFLGSADGGMHVILNGKDKAGNPISTKWFVIALDGHGPYIPAVPAVVLTRKILAGQFRTGAMACIGLVSLEEYRHELKDSKVKTYESTSVPGTA